jgi:hypothetical protein
MLSLTSTFGGSSITSGLNGNTSLHRGLDSLPWSNSVSLFCSRHPLALIIPGFFITYGVTGLRELLTKKGEHKSRGYQQLPQ